MNNEPVIPKNVTYQSLWRTLADGNYKDYKKRFARCDIARFLIEFYLESDIFNIGVCNATQERRNALFDLAIKHAPVARPKNPNPVFEVIFHALNERVTDILLWSMYPDDAKDDVIHEVALRCALVRANELVFCTLVELAPSNFIASSIVARAAVSENRRFLLACLQSGKIDCKIALYYAALRAALNNRATNVLCLVTHPKWVHNNSEPLLKFASRCMEPRVYRLLRDTLTLRKVMDSREALRTFRRMPPEKKRSAIEYARQCAERMTQNKHTSV